MRRGQHRTLKWIITLGMIAVLIVSGNTMGKETVLASDHTKVLSSAFLKENITASEKPQLTHEDITLLTNKFMDILVQDIDSNYKVNNFDTKEELLNEFSTVTTKEIAQEFVDFFYMEEADGLYILPTETPPWFLETNDYDMIKVNDSTVKVVQDNYTDLDGNYTVEFEFTYDTEWKITNIAYK
ncbi:hypothetical protein [Oceanobacillus massiliensis]|uniref:hypothetical protein n=1 Tax=Oceanobacillus massiliensis TaxID=1465765 RepID=UPI003016CCCD